MCWYIMMMQLLMKGGVLISIIAVFTFLYNIGVAPSWHAHDIQKISEILIATVRKYYKPSYKNVRIEDLISMGQIPDKYVSEDRKFIVTKFGSINVKSKPFDETHFIVEVVNIPSIVCEKILKNIKENESSYKNIKIILNYDEDCKVCFSNSTNTIEFETK